MRIERIQIKLSPELIFLSITNQKGPLEWFYVFLDGIRALPVIKNASVVLVLSIIKQWLKKEQDILPFVKPILGSYQEYLVQVLTDASQEKKGEWMLMEMAKTKGNWKLLRLMDQNMRSL